MWVCASTRNQRRTHTLTQKPSSSNGSDGNGSITATTSSAQKFIRSIHFVQASFAYFLCTPRPNAIIYTNAIHTDLGGRRTRSRTHTHTLPNSRTFVDAKIVMQNWKLLFEFSSWTPKTSNTFICLNICVYVWMRASKRACSNCGRKEKPTKLSLPIRTNEKYYFGRK